MILLERERAVQNSKGLRGAKPLSDSVIAPGIVVKTRLVCGRSQGLKRVSGEAEFQHAPSRRFGALGWLWFPLLGGLATFPSSPAPSLWGWRLPPVSPVTRAASIPPRPPSTSPGRGTWSTSGSPHRFGSPALRWPRGRRHAALPAPGARGPRRLRPPGVEERWAGKEGGCGEGDWKTREPLGARRVEQAGAVWAQHRRRPAPFGCCATCGSGCRCQLGGCVPTWRRRQRGRPRGAGPRRADGNTDDGPETRLHLYHGESRDQPNVAITGARRAVGASPARCPVAGPGGRSGHPGPAPRGWGGARRGRAQWEFVKVIKTKPKKQGLWEVPAPGRVGGVSVGGGGGPRCPHPPQKKKNKPGRAAAGSGAASPGTAAALGAGWGAGRGGGPLREGWWQGRGERRGDSWSQAERGEPAWLLSAAVLRILG